MTIETPVRPEINGATRLIAIIGDPIRQVKSPAFYNEQLAAAGVNAVLVPWHATPENFDVVMSGLVRTSNLDGIVVTYPHKQQAVAFADQLEPMAEFLGTVNVLRREADGRWTGGMFDGYGLVEAAKHIGFIAKNASIQLVGVGGAGSAIAYALAEEGAARISIVENDRAKLDAVTARLASLYPQCLVEQGLANLKSIDLLVNATPVGLKDNDGLPIPADTLTERTSVIDIVPGRETLLLRTAAKLGCRTLGGSAMVEGQTGIVLRFLNKIEAIAKHAAKGAVSG